MLNEQVTPLLVIFFMGKVYRRLLKFSNFLSHTISRAKWSTHSLKMLQANHVVRFDS